MSHRICSRIKPPQPFLFPIVTVVPRLEVYRTVVSIFASSYSLSAFHSSVYLNWLSISYRCSVCRCRRAHLVSLGPFLNHHSHPLRSCECAVPLLSTLIAERIHFTYLYTVSPCLPGFKEHTYPSCTRSDAAFPCSMPHKLVAVLSQHSTDTS